MQARLYIVAYDIACPKRWRRVQKVLKAICRRGQLSVFLCRASPARIARLDREMRRILHQRDDRLMILDLGVVHHAAPKLEGITMINPMSDISDLGAAIL